MYTIVVLEILIKSMEYVKLFETKGETEEFENFCIND